MPRMGDLAAQDAYDVPLEQSTGVGWANRLGEILNARPQYDETVRYKTASPLVNITEGDIGRATEAAMAASGGGLSTKGIKAYHSSPHDFDKFDLSKIGTGEGAQAYGHGLYFAENPAVSGQGGQYWNQFLSKFSGPEMRTAEFLKQHGFDREATIAELKRQYADPKMHSSRSGIQTKLDLLGDNVPVGPRTYEVNINADPARFLDWDKPLREMSPEVQRAAGRLVERDIPNEPGWGKTTGEQFHTAVGERVGQKPEVAAALREAGIPGIKYLDQGSRLTTNPTLIRQAQDNLLAARDELAMAQQSGDKAWIARQQDRLVQAEAKANPPPPSSNYVVFDPKIIDIMKKYGLAGATAGTMGALAAQDEYKQ